MRGIKRFLPSPEALTLGATLLVAIAAAFSAWSEQIARLDKLLLVQARQDPARRRLMTAPGVGAIIAFVAAIDDPGRFR